MNIEVKSSNGISLIPTKSVLFESRKVFIDDEINDETAMEFIKQIMILTERDRKAPIDVLINSPGGVIISGMAMYDCIQASKTPIRMFCVGSAASMAATIFCCGKNGRYMLPHSELMIHEPLLGGSISGNASSIHSRSEQLMETKRRMNQILAKHTGRTIEEIEEATSYDHYMTPEECIEFGFADKIVDFGMIIGG
jgi:ATP-dependent Clp protease protease subunit